jgi:hypothetical protein
MTRIAWITAGCLVSAAVAIAIVGRGFADDVLLGMLGPLVAVALTWLLIERTVQHDPARLTQLLMTAFFVKMVFFGVYVVAVLRGVPGVETMPFAVSFTAYFISLYAIEAVLMDRLASRAAR